MGRTHNAKIAQETVTILEQGFYQNSKGNQIEIRDSLNFCKNNTKLYTSRELDVISASITSRLSYAKDSIEPISTRTQVTNETTLEAAKRIVGESYKLVVCLNFASANNPGGGFLNGSQAQEESLARASGLYASLISQPQFYEFHRQQNNLLYSDRIIYSPNVPVFRDDGGNLIDEPYLLSIITSPAPNAGAIAKNMPHLSNDLDRVLRERSAKILALAVSLEYSQIILGAWGCGVFRNSPQQIAAIFKEHLDTEYRNKFERVIFAIFDTSQEQVTLNAFKQVFT